MSIVDEHVFKKWSVQGENDDCPLFVNMDVANQFLKLGKKKKKTVQAI